MSLFCYLLFHFHSENLLLTIYLFPSDQVRINEADGYLYYIIQSTLKTHRLFSSNLWQDTASFSSPIWDLLSTSHFCGHTTGLHADAKTTILPRILQRFDMYAKQERILLSTTIEDEHLIFFRKDTTNSSSPILGQWLIAVSCRSEKSSSL